MRELELTGNKIHKQPHRITIPNKILTLIGENGCGKSSILEALFDQYKEDELLRIICFSSGQNESFTKIYNKYLKDSNKYLIDSYADKPLENYINSFFFNKDWVKLLIFFASSLKFDGLTNTFLRKNGYLIKDNEGNELPLFILFPFRILKYYINKIEYALKQEESQFDYKSIRNTIFHQLLSKIAEQEKDSYDFERPLVKTKIMLSSKNILTILDNKNVDAIFTFLGLATKDDRFIIKNEADLILHGVELNQISDGEFQLLTIYAILDLFDGVNTLFLFDEIDSHLYFENVGILWNTLQGISGSVITTTHSADSIIKNSLGDIKLVDKGLIDEDSLLDKITSRLSFLTDADTYQKKLAAKAKYLALIEDEKDWFIFKQLCKVKIADFDESKFNQIHYIKKSSDYDQGTQIYGFAKINWVNEFNTVNPNNAIKTEAIFLICDRDEYSIGSWHPNGVSITGENKITKFGNNKNAFLLGWKRREIENYLLSYTMLELNGKLTDGIRLFPPDTIIKNQSGDIEDMRVKDVKTFVQTLYLNDLQNGIDYNKLESLINQIPSDEISEDILNMYNFIISKIA